jgi:hypothetical protein
VDACLRCGQSLHGLADEQPCPGCGLPAGRSRRPSDALHHTRPAWLRRLSAGVWLLLPALPVACVWALVLIVLDVSSARLTGLFSWPWDRHLAWSGLDLAAVAVAAGAWLLSGPEGYAEADQADRRSRLALRLVGFLPLLAVALRHFETEYNYSYYPPLHVRYLFSLGIDPVVLAIAACTPLPVLLFRRLRELAKRARNAHLAEHAHLVGVGLAGGVLYAAAYALASTTPERVGLPYNWSYRSTFGLIVMTVLGAAALLFTLWSLYLLGRFALAFRVAARTQRRQWAVGDLPVARAVE